MKNLDIRATMMKYDIRQYEVAKKMNIKPDTLAHYFMWGLTLSQKKRVLAAIKSIIMEKKNGTKN